MKFSIKMNETARMSEKTRKPTKQPGRFEKIAIRSFAVGAAGDNVRQA